jgi:hypothetical protein
VTGAGVRVDRHPRPDRQQPRGRGGMCADRLVRRSRRPPSTRGRRVQLPLRRS